MPSVLDDARYAIRRLRRATGFVSISVLSLGLGIGATATMFAVVLAVDFRQLPFENADRLVTVRDVAPLGSRYCRKDDCSTYTSMPMIADLERDARTLEDVASYPLFTEHLWNHGDETEPINVVRVSGNLFHLLGARPLLGRTFAPSELTAGGDQVIVLAYDFWKNRFAGRPSVIGERMTIADDNNRTESSYTIVGVMREGFRVLSEVGWLPAQPTGSRYDTSRVARMFLSIARLAPGRTLEEAKAESRAIAARAAIAFPQTNASWSADLRPFDAPSILRIRTQNAPENAGQGRQMLLGVVAIVLLIATFNVSALSLVRAGVRRHELTVRTALGASRRRLTREAMSESLAVSLAGGVLGTLVAFWGVRVAVVSLSLDYFPIPISVDWRVVGFAMAVSTVVGLCVGVLPVLRLSAIDLRSTLQARSATGGTAAAGSLWPQRVLVAAEVASSLILVTGGALLAKELYRLRYDVPGYDAHALYQLQIRLSDSAIKQSDRQRQTAMALLDGVRAVPGVGDASLGAPSFGSYSVPGGLDSLVGPLRPIGFAIGPEFFRTTKTPIVRGRAFDQSDREGAPLVVIVDQTAADLYWPGKDPVGRELRFLGEGADSGKLATVVGVAAPARMWIAALARETAVPYVYRPITQTWSDERRIIAVFTRLDGTAQRSLGPVRAALRSVSGRAVDTGDVVAMESEIADQLRQHRLDAIALTSFAIVGLFLAAMGIYGLVAFTVVQRTREVGIRMALGADQSNIRRLLTRGGLKPALAGVAVGAYGAYLFTRLLGALLVGTSARDPGAFVISALVMLAVAFIASLIPARRATRIDPALALRAD